MNTPQKPVWFITGCSTGFGRALARHVVGLGYPTVVTARNVDQVADIVTGFESSTLVQALDVTDPAQIEGVTKAALARFGRIDVLVNNAGIGYFGSFEESDMAEVHKMFDINVWGLAAMTRAVLPDMRRRRSGTIVNLSSVGGIRSNAATTFYCGTKFAVEALSEGLSIEVAPLGIRVLLVEPGPFRTDWAGRSANEAPQTIADYRETAGARAAQVRGNSGKQVGDPHRAALAIVQAVEASTPPLRLLLGNVAVDAARAKIEWLRRDFDTWEAISRGADFPAK